jgi:beta-xylosidase
LKDHSIFIYDGYYYLISIYVPLGTNDPLKQNKFIYARSTDLCNWENLGYVLQEREPKTWDDTAVWAPFVLEEAGTYYLFYTGVKQEGTQSILLATTNNPADPTSWQPEPMVFQPDHPGMVWRLGEWADCRDPMVIKIANDSYILYYTGSDETGGIIGWAESTSLSGQWVDQGSLSAPEPAMRESPFVLFHDQTYYLFYNRAYIGEYYQTSTSHLGPWSDEEILLPGWGHEFFVAKDGELYTSYLTDLTVTISPVSWDHLFTPPKPFWGETVYHHFIPNIINQY